MNKLELKIIPNVITMKSIQYDWLGRIKKVEFRDLEEIKNANPDFYEQLVKNLGTPQMVIVNNAP